jgi:hypothetical protein
MDVSAVSITDKLIRTAAGKYTLSGPNVPLLQAEMLQSVFLKPEPQLS